MAEVQIVRLVYRAGVALLTLLNVTLQAQAPPKPAAKVSTYGAGPAAATGTAILADPATYGYSPTSVLALGRGFAPSDITLAKLPCITFTEQKLDPGPPSTTHATYYVRDQTELDATLGLEFKLKNSTLIASAGGGFKFDYSHNFRADTVMVVMRATTDFGRWALKPEPTLTAAAAALLGDADAFEDRCGSRYVAIERRGAFVAAVVTATGVSQEDKQTFSAEFNAGTGGKVGPSAEAKLSSMLRIAAKQQRLSVDIVATGGGGLGGLGSLVAKSAKLEKNNIEEIFVGLGDYLKTFTEQNAAATGYMVASMSHFGWDEGALDPWTDLHEDRLGRIALAYRAARADVEAIDAIASGADERSDLLTLMARDHLKKRKPELEARLPVLAQAHATCKRATVGDIDVNCPVIAPHVSFLPPFPDPMAIKYTATLTFDKPDPVTGNTWEMLDAVRTRMILNSAPKHRLHVAQSLKLNTTGVGIVQGFHGDLLFSGYLVFHEIDSNGIEVDTWEMTTEEALKGRSLTWFVDSGAGPIAGYGEEAFKQHVCEYRGTHQGVIRMHFRDRGNRLRVVDAYDVAWKSDGGGCNFGRFDIIF